MMREPAGDAPRARDSRSPTAAARSGTATTGCSSAASWSSLVGTWMQQVAQAWLVLELTQRPADPRPDHGARVPARARARAVRRPDRGRPAQAADADGHPGGPDDARVRPVRASSSPTPSRCGRSSCSRRCSASPTPSTCRPARRSPSRWSGREDVANAVALNSAVFNGARIVGPAIAGLTIGFFGGDVVVAFLINGLSASSP